MRFAVCLFTLLCLPRLVAARDVPAAARLLADELYKGFTLGGRDAPRSVGLESFTGDDPVAWRAAGQLANELALELGTAYGLALGDVASAAVRLKGEVSCGPQACDVDVEAITPETDGFLVAVSVTFERPPERAVAEDPNDAPGVMQAMAHKLAEQLRRLPTAGAEPRFGVVPFADRGRVSTHNSLGSFVTYQLHMRLQRDFDFTMLEPAVLADTLEQAGQSARDLDISVALSIAGKLGLRGIIVGSVAPGDKDMVARAQVISAVRGEVVAQEDALFPTPALLAMAGVTPPSFGSYLRPVVPGLSQLLDDEPMKGWSIIAGEAAFLGLTAVFQVLGKNAQDNYDQLSDPRQVAQFDAFYDQANRYYTWRNISIGLAILTYAYNWVDALGLGQQDVGI